jgi:hypothetical protein
VLRRNRSDRQPAGRTDDQFSTLENPMAKNRFEQVDTPQPDAITLSLTSRDGKPFGTITCPSEVSGGRLQQDVTSDEMDDVQAFRSAIRLANEIKAPIVVMDPQGMWNPDWGDLYRDDQD